MNKMYTSVIALGFLLLQSISAAEAFNIDQLQPIVDGDAGGFAIGGTSEQKLAQTVTVGLDGRLAGLFLPIGCDSGALVIEIQTLDGDEPSGIVLRRQRVRAARIPQIGPVFHFFRINGNLRFDAGDRFAIVLTNPMGSCGIFRSPEGDTYAGGEGFFDALPNLPGWVPFSETETRLDLPFMTLVR